MLYFSSHSHGWDITKSNGWWIGCIRWGSEDSAREYTGFIAIIPDHDPLELATDALLDFIDRLRERRIPRDVEDPITLMDMCVWAARRQR